VSDPFVEPDRQLGDPSVLLVEFLQLYRSTLLRKVHGMTQDQLRTSMLPSGWTPLELIKHLAHVEQRWIQWGFLALPVTDPWGDLDPNTTGPLGGPRWQVDDNEDLDQLRDLLHRHGAETDRVLSSHPLDQPAGVGGRFDSDPPTLAWIGFHLLQEYARHVGQLDVVRELIDHRVGE
jgi:hypothetical protein